MSGGWLDPSDSDLRDLELDLEYLEYPEEEKFKFQEDCNIQVSLETLIEEDWAGPSQEFTETRSIKAWRIA